MSDAVEQIKQRLTIVDVVSPYVELTRAGKNYKGKSPFTSEKTPSFYVSPDRGLYYCFSSSQGGDMFTFVQQMEGVDFKGALKLLAEQANVELVKEDPAKRTERDAVHAALAEAAAFWHAERAKTPHAVGYLKDRGLTEHTIAKWQLGYAPGPPVGGWRDTKQHLNAAGFPDEILKKAGLIKTPEGGKESYDVFRDRLMFPMCDPSGRVVAFSGRLLAKETEAPKYVNSPETELYKKSELLFGYDKAKEGIRKLDFSLIVEGQFDVVLCHQAGYTNTVAVSGTALTMHHVGLLERLSGRVVLALDADRAGIAAVKRAANLMLRRGLDVKVAELPEGEDPADLIKAGGGVFKKIIGQSSHVVEFLLTVLERHAKDERQYKLLVREEVLPYVVLIENRIDREHFETLVAERLGATKDAIHFEVTRLAERVNEETSGAAAAAPSSADTATATDAAAPLPRRLENVRPYAVMLGEVTSGEEQAFVQTAVAEILGVTYEDAKASVPAALQGEYLFTLEQSFAELPVHERRARIEDVIQELERLTGKEHIRTLRTQLTAAETAGDESAVTRLLQELANAQARLAQPPRQLSSSTPM